MSNPEATITTIAPGVKQVSVGAPFSTHVYLIESEDGPIAFDAGIKGTGVAILTAAGGRLDRVVLSHSHVDHRGAAAELGAPIYCHTDEVADAEGDAGRSYIDFSLIKNDTVREVLPQLNAQWDGGPVSISGTVSEGDEIAGFRVIHTPGHAPGQIALFRESDRLLLAADTIYTLDPETGQPGSPRVPHPFSNWNTELARRSIRSLMRLQASGVWTGHAEGIAENITEQLEQAASYGLQEDAA